jgi:hypothetical protein
MLEMPDTMLFYIFLTIIAYLVMTKMMIGDVKFMKSIFELRPSLQAGKVKDNIFKIALNAIVGFCGLCVSICINCPELLIFAIFVGSAFMVKLAANASLLICGFSPEDNS